MAADQRKKHLNAGHSSREQHKVKRKKVILSTIRSNITLEWDDKRKSVVPWREQIVIAWRDLSAFIDSVPNCYSALADIVSVPRETIELEDLIEVLSCEVAMTHPLAVTNCNIDMESLISDQNRSIATLAITTLLKTGNESSVDRLMKQITNFMSDIADEFKIVVVEAIRSLCLKFPLKYRSLDVQANCKYLLEYLGS